MKNEPRLELLCEYYATLKDPVVVGNGPYGMRQIYDITGGEVTGPRLRGRILPSGADWILLGADGVGRLDVRGTIETDDGAHIYISYTGVLHMTENVLQALAGGGLSEFGETYFYVNPRLETGDPRYAWLNGLFIVNQGRVGPSRVEYRCYQVK
ncbi:MAG: DUF3237 domain-containing protein [Deltaproteobacteria bacterium]|nr:DUF3237 domain-containing protein [Deltaproteobacteria bacterium]